MAAAQACSAKLLMQTLDRPEVGGSTCSSAAGPPHPQLCRFGSLQTTATSLRKVPIYIIKGRKASSLDRSSRLVSVSASAASAAPSLSDPAYRAKLAEDYGFTQIAEPLPPEVTMRMLMETIPLEAFKMTEWKAWRGLALSLSGYLAGLYLIAIAPWYLLPFAWAWTGTAAAGLFNLGHECGHRVFSHNKLVEDIVGHLLLVPLIYPFEPWRLKHDQHHAKTNMLHGDTAWIPVMREEHAKRSPFRRTMFVLLLGPLRFWATIYHWIDRHFFLDKFRPNEQNRVKISLGVVFATVTIGWPLLIYLTGFGGWAKFWLMPWLWFHFWLSIYTMVHHTAPHIKFNPAATWNNAQAHLTGTVNCEYPRLIELYLHDINIHIPHHISTKIPSYNLRLANDALRKRWGKHFNEARWNWRLMKTQFAQCHYYDEDKNYVPFDDGREEMLLLRFVRKFMPNIA